MSNGQVYCKYYNLSLQSKNKRENLYCLTQENLVEFLI